MLFNLILQPLAAVPSGRCTARSLGSDFAEMSLASRAASRRVKCTAADDESRMRMYIYSTLGLLAIDHVTLDAAEAVMRSLLACLYPDEDARLMSCRAVPLEYRLVWGFLDRESPRLGEALALAWADLNLEHGAVRSTRTRRTTGMHGR